MADFEDACSPTWDNLVEGQINLKDRWAGKIDFIDPQTKQVLRARRQARGADRCARAAGTCVEDHVTVDGAPVAGALFDFGLYFFHNAKRTDRRRHRPLFLPAEDGEPSRGAALERGLRLRASEARRADGTIKATVLIETLPAAFEMDEILYEMRDHIAGLNCGRWDYIFSFIKRLGKNKRFLHARPLADGDGQGLPARLFAAADPDLPPPRRLRHGRHGGADPGEGRCRRQRGRLRQGPRRQGARGGRRP